MEQFPPDDILESLYISGDLMTVLELYNLEIQNQAKLDFGLILMVKGSIEHDLRTRNFETRNGKMALNMPVKNQREQRHVLKGQGDCLKVGSLRAVLELEQL